MSGEARAEGAERDRELLGALEEEAVRSGVELVEIDVKDIRPRQALRLKCLVPLCEYYGVSKVCPPNIPSVEEFREALGDYERAFLVVLREKIDALETYQTDFAAELRLAEAVAKLEVAAFGQGRYLTLGLVVGGCKHCRKCAPAGEPCRHPFKARPSPEGFGVDVTELARNAGVPVEWPPKEYVNFLGLLLL
jgi:predicted metal-binding protein